ncbi:hypothetical protein [Streptomyces sioyaensis]|uniref:hypothetical protein n=1 Tax=Streptomyces sioyaensis TaxID=67364 RepID=UPI0036EAB3E6
MNRQLVHTKREITGLHQQLAAAATVIAALHHDNQLLRAEHTTAGTLTVLPPRPHDTAGIARSRQPQHADRHAPRPR